ncbi:MAG: hypothetical protein LBT83_06440 [Tannerella sp.]|jgi:hypothetical protein|nr:hypothetical protein [Tannerella sp.]
MKALKFSALFCTLVILLQACQKQEQPEWQRKYNPEEVRKMFAEPPMFYAPHTFWFWDDTIKDEHFAASMIDEMALQRLNPGYAHPRSGFYGRSISSLPLEQYLEQPWFNSFGNALQKAKDNGMTLGFCDEYNWPSGHAAGRVLEQSPDLEAKYLDWKRYEVKGKSAVRYESADFAVAGKWLDKKIDASSLQIIGEGKNIEWTAPEGDWVVYTYEKKHHPGVDGGKVNYLDPKLMEVFIPLVHEQYEKHFGDEMGKSIPGVFVDNEGDYGWKMAWSEYLSQRYNELKNRDIRLWLPLLTEKDSDGLFAKARYDWFDVVSEVYTECYFEPLVSWLKQRNMYYISNLWEESLHLETAAVGDLMRTTRAVTMPGTDCLLMKSQDVHDFKEVQSVAEFEDRPCMSEIMGVAGWEQTPEMMKMTINSITSFGVNHVVPHGISTTRKVETIVFPADWFTENPYWPYLHYWTDFSRRASFVARQSQLVADVLLINPFESVWALSENCFSGEPWDKRAVETDQVYSGAMSELNKNNIDFLIADNYYLDRGSIESSDKRATITINNHEFSAMALPPVCVIPHTSLDKILAFAKKGGVVILLGELPQGSTENGMNDPAIDKKTEELVQIPSVIRLAEDENRLEKMITVLNEKVKPQIRLENAGRLYTAHRKIGVTDIYWLANNTDETKNFTAWLRDGEGVAEIWDCETGEISSIPSEKDKGYNKASLTLHPYQAYWLAFNPNGKSQKKQAKVQTASNEILFDGAWTVRYTGQDTVCKAIAKALVSGDKTIDEEKLNLDYNDSDWKYVNLIQQPENKMETTGNVYWRISIPVGAKSMILPAGMTDTEIRLDGKKTLLKDTVIDLPAGARLLSFVSPAGKQSGCDFPLKFIVGDKENCPLQSWYTYGLEQYTGYLDYETSVKTDKTTSPVSIDLGNVKYMAEVFVNDKSVGARLWPPFVFDISKKLKQGENKIRIRVGNLMVGDMWLKNNMGQLNTWGWRGDPDFVKYDAGMLGPVRIRN